MTNDALLTFTDREEALSRAYVRAVAGFTGYTISEEDFDRDGIDLRIQAGGPMSPAIGMQLKATINLGDVRSDGCYRYPLPTRNYRRLIRPSQVPRYLLLLALPHDENEWLTISEAELVMRRCAYYVSLLGARESDNRDNITVCIPSENRFNSNVLIWLLDESRGLAQGLSDAV